MTNPLSAAVQGAAPAASRSSVDWLIRRRVTLTIVLIVAACTLDLSIGRVGAHGAFGGGWLQAISAATAILAGLLVRSWAAGTIYKWERLATTGPYAWVRHPLYVGSIVLTLGFCGLMQSPLLSLLILLPLTPIYWLAIRQEEAVLARRYAEWSAYSQRVGCLLPRRVAWTSLCDWSAAQWLRNREYSAWLGAAAVTALIIFRTWWT